MMDDTSADLCLQKNDVLYIPSVKDIEKEGTLSIYGDVRVRVSFLMLKIRLYRI